MDVQVSRSYADLESSVTQPGVVWLKHVGTVSLAMLLWEPLHRFPQPLPRPPVSSAVKDSFLPPSPPVSICWFLGSQDPRRKKDLSVVLFCISPVAKDAGHFLIYSLPICISLTPSWTADMDIQGGWSSPSLKTLFSFKIHFIPLKASPNFPPFGAFPSSVDAKNIIGTIESSGHSSLYPPFSVSRGKMQASLGFLMMPGSFNVRGKNFLAIKNTLTTGIQDLCLLMQWHHCSMLTPSHFIPKI